MLKALFEFVPVDDGLEEEAVVPLGEPDPLGEVVVPLTCLAWAWKAAKLLGPDSIAFTLKTMPVPEMSDQHGASSGKKE